MFKKKEARFPLTEQGIKDMMAYKQSQKLKKINSYTYIAVILVMFGVGFLPKEMMVLMVANKGINGVTGLFFN